VETALATLLISTTLRRRRKQLTSDWRCQFCGQEHSITSRLSTRVSGTEPSAIGCHLTHSAVKYHPLFW